jgi:hypothetical protein
MGGEREIVSLHPPSLLFAESRFLIAIPGWTNTDDVMCRDHARKAVQFWTVVVERTGSSRFDVEEARERLRDAQQMLRQMASSMSQT